MAQTCMGLCDRLKSISMKNGLRYSTGQKRCSLCASFFCTEENNCPCCKTRLRSKARNRNRRQDFPK